VSRSLYNKILDVYILWDVAIYGIGIWFNYSLFGMVYGFVYAGVMFVPCAYMFWVLWGFRFKEWEFV
jgi:hypothetical protein